MKRFPTEITEGVCTDSKQACDGFGDGVAATSSDEVEAEKEGENENGDEDEDGRPIPSKTTMQGFMLGTGIVLQAAPLVNNTSTTNRPKSPITQRFTVTIAMQTSILESIKFPSDAHVRLICSIPQRDPLWFSARKHHITGSVAGTAIGVNPYPNGKPNDLLRQLLWPSFQGNKFTRYGTEQEPYAQQAYIDIMRAKHGPTFQLGLPGLILSRKSPETAFLAYSADGIACFPDGTKRLIEIKCPFRKVPYPSVPRMYFAQMQLGMFILDLPSCDFCVYCGPDRHYQITNIPRDDDFLENVLIPGLMTFYYCRYLPLAAAQERGWIKKDSIHFQKGVRSERLAVPKYQFPQRDGDEIF